MNKFLITGRAGSGKSAINQELRERNYNSFDTDKIPGLTRWENLQGNPIKVDASKYVDYSEVSWNWNKNILQSMLVARKAIFFCGSASNDLELMPLFDRVFVLTLDPKVQLERLRQREESYGKDPRQQQEIIEEQIVFVEQATSLGAIPINNDRPIKAVVDEIIGASGV